MTNATRWMVAAVLWAAAIPAASAQDTDAEVAFRAGRDLLAAGKISEACAKFSESQDLAPALGTLLNLADCRERQGKTAAAFVAFTKLKALAEKERRAEFATEASKRLAALSPKLTSLRLTMRERVGGLTVTLNGVDVTTSIDKPIPVDPGTQSITARADGYADWSRELEASGAGQTLVFEIALEKKTPKVIEEPTDPPLEDPVKKPLEVTDPPPPSREGGAGGSSRRLLALGVGAGGVALTGTGLLFGALARSAYDDRVEHCQVGNVCTPRGIEIIDDAKTKATVATILTVAGVAAVAGAAVLYLTAPSDEAPRTSVVPTVGRDFAGVAVMGEL